MPDMHLRGAEDIESTKKRTLIFHAGLAPKINFGILTIHVHDSHRECIDQIA